MRVMVLVRATAASEAGIMPPTELLETMGAYNSGTTTRAARPRDGEASMDLESSSALFDRPVLAVARDLVGATLLVGGVGGTIVETEAYDREDPASHSFAGETARNRSMFGPPGRAYVYRSYGLHWCLNIVCGPPGHGSAVLIRALRPEAGLDVMAARRGTANPRLLCSGPGRLTQALGIARAHDGVPLDAPPFRLTARGGPVEVVSGPRIGISKAADLPWRFGLAGAPDLSRPFPRPAAQ